MQQDAPAVTDIRSEMRQLAEKIHGAERELADLYDRREQLIEAAVDYGIMQKLIYVDNAISKTRFNQIMKNIMKKKEEGTG